MKRRRKVHIREGLADHSKGVQRAAPNSFESSSWKCNLMVRDQSDDGEKTGRSFERTSQANILDSSDWPQASAHTHTSNIRL